MNRRGFISMLAGAAGSIVVPWRAEVSRIITLGAPNVLVAVTGLELMQHPELRGQLVDQMQNRLTGLYEPVIPSVNMDCAFMHRSAYRAHLMRIGPWHDYRFDTERGQYYADLRADARAALADDLLHDWSRDQPSGERIWS